MAALGLAALRVDESEREVDVGVTAHGGSS
jgi:hypothetical protein